LIFLAKHQFKSLRGDFYFDLAESMASAKGTSISKLLEKYARRYKKEPIGIMCSHWLANLQHSGTFSAAVVGTIPDQDLALLAAAEDAGDLMIGLRQLGINIRGMKR